uniref:Uncharacterized protein n=1 Tax=viral metagenome TaxID=1070528 RepID=A0A6C0BCR6_9ZZZZ
MSFLTENTIIPTINDSTFITESVSVNFAVENTNEPAIDTTNEQAIDTTNILLEESDGWKIVTSNNDKVSKKKTSKKDEIKKVHEVVPSWLQKKKQTTETLSPKKLFEKKNSLDLLREHIDMIHNEVIWNAARYLKTLILKGAESNAYMMYYPSVEITSYLQPKNKTFFHQVVSHRDKGTSTRISLFDWTFQGKHLYIFTTSPWSRQDGRIKTPVAKKRAIYNKIAQENSIPSKESPNAIILSDEGFTKLRNLAWNDIATEFMKLLFYDDYSLASAAVRAVATERVQFSKKSSKKEETEIDSKGEYEQNY